VYIGSILVFWFKAKLAEVPFLTGGGSFHNDSAPTRAHKPWTRLEKVVYFCVVGLVGTAYTLCIGSIIVFFLKAKLAEASAKKAGQATPGLSIVSSRARPRRTWALRGYDTITAVDMGSIA
jgi:hypothetical protein